MTVRASVRSGSLRGGSPTRLRAIRMVSGWSIDAGPARSSRSVGRRSTSEAGPTPGVFAFTRTGSTSNALTVNYQFSGTATKWLDYRSAQGDMPDSMTIPAGAASATLTIYPVVDNVTEGSETAVLTIAPAPAYNAGQPKSATVTIVESPL